MSTVGLLVWLRQLTTSLKTVAAKDFASEVLKAWLLFMLPSNANDEVEAPVPAGISQRCQTRLDELGYCIHIRASRESAMKSGSPQLKCTQ
eukprot:6023200-Prorocentrum_lima.AAC.1